MVTQSLLSVVIMAVSAPITSAFVIKNNPVQQPAFARISSERSVLQDLSTLDISIDTTIRGNPLLDALIEECPLNDSLPAANAASPATTDLSVIKLTWEPEMAEQIRKTVHMRRNRRQGADANQPYMVAVVGIPGSGKSTSCSVLTDFLSDTGCCLMPFDGYHYPVRTLQQMENPDDKLYRRGAPDTFDVEALQRDLRRIRYGGDMDKHEIVSVPGFDHAAGDPEDDAHRFVRSEHSILICEGLYLLHDQDGWDDVKDLFDLTIFVEANVNNCVDRLKERNQCIPGYTKEEIAVRCDAVDRVNAWTVEDSKQYADVTVQSIAA